MTPLYIANERGHGAVVQLLLQQNADLNILMKVLLPSTLVQSIESHIVACNLSVMSAHPYIDRCSDVHCMSIIHLVCNLTQT